MEWARDAAEVEAEADVMSIRRVSRVKILISF